MRSFCMGCRKESCQDAPQPPPRALHVDPLYRCCRLNCLTNILPNGTYILCLFCIYHYFGRSRDLLEQGVRKNHAKIIRSHPHTDSVVVVCFCSFCLDWIRGSCGTGYQEESREDAPKPSPCALYVDSPHRRRRGRHMRPAPGGGSPSSGLMVEQGRHVFRIREDVSVPEAPAGECLQAV